MSVFAIVLWAVLAAALGALLLGMALSHLRQLWDLRKEADILRAGQVKLWGRLRVRGQPLPYPPNAALADQLYVAAAVNEEAPDEELKRLTVQRAADCELVTPKGSFDLDTSYFKLQTAVPEIINLTPQELEGGPAAELLHHAHSKSGTQQISYKLNRDVLPDGAPVLVLADATEVASEGSAAPRWRLGGQPTLPMVICEGTPKLLLGWDLYWSAALAIFGSVCLYHGGILLYALCWM